jgi:hypothetical protein
MLSVLSVRVDAAKAAAPYVHPKLANIEHTDKNGKDLIPEPEMTSNELGRRVAFLLQQGLQSTGDDA